MFDRLSQNARLVIASLISVAIIFGWQIMFVEPMIKEQQEEMERVALTVAKDEQHIPQKLESREQIISNEMSHGTRVKFQNAKIKGSINLVGARIDDLILENYSQSLEEKEKKVTLLSPGKALDSYFIELGWISADKNFKAPDKHAVWHADRNELKEGETVTLSHSAEGVTYKIAISLDKDYLFSINQTVINKSGMEIAVAPYALANRINQLLEQNNFVFHEGLIGVSNNTLKEVSYSDMQENKTMDLGEYSWVGFSDKYWLTSFISQNDSQYKVKATYSERDNVGRFQIGLNPQEATKVKSDSSHSWGSFKIFAGAKELELLEHYQDTLNVKLFDRAVDFGMLYFITKPISYLLHVFYQFLNNFGVAILALTVLIKVLLFPLAYKGFKGMNRLKDLQPKIVQLKEKFADDPSAFQKAMLDVYKKEKVNPMGGCLPILLQIPVFFALYKVLYVSIEMRQAPFFWWIKDLSVPDPLSIFNLFGLIPIDLPSFLMIGILPILMSLTMFIQQSLNPEPADPVQAKVMKFLPVILLFMFASFPSGLIIYWTWSNILSIAQQIFIKRISTKR